VDGAGIDPGIAELMAQWRAATPWLHVPVLWLTDAGWLLLVVAALVAPFVAHDRVRRVRAWVALVAVPAVWLTNSFLKQVFAEPRPCLALPHLDTLSCPASFAFPSGHTTVVAATAATLWVTSRRWLAVAGTVLAAGVAASRVYLGAHYLHDVVAAAVLASSLALLITLGGARLLTRRDAPERPAATARAPGPTRPPGDRPGRP
jgi:membrane-associated phospholipid phosphatase